MRRFCTLDFIELKKTIDFPNNVNLQCSCQWIFDFSYLLWKLYQTVGFNVFSIGSSFTARAQQIKFLNFHLLYLDSLYSSSYTQEEQLGSKRRYLSFALSFRTYLLRLGYSEEKSEKLWGSKSNLGGPLSPPSTPIVAIKYS